MDWPIYSELNSNTLQKHSIIIDCYHWSFTVVSGLKLESHGQRLKEMLPGNIVSRNIFVSTKCSIATVFR